MWFQLPELEINYGNQHTTLPLVPHARRSGQQAAIGGAEARATLT